MRRISPTSFRVARRGTSREINRQIALNLVRSKQPISRAELARLMGVRRGAVSRLVKDLMRAKLVFEGAKGESKRGRKPRHLYIETRRNCALAVDVSASRILVLVTDPLGHPLLEIQELATRTRPHGFVKELARQLEHLLGEHPEFGQCLGVGVVVAGLVDIARGRLRNAPTLGWQNVEIKVPLQAALKLPVVVENDVKACVLAQLWAVRGHAPVDGPVAFVNASDGVGVGIAIDGQLLRGAQNNAGELGHVTLSLDGPLCACGQKGCWEAYVSVRAIVARYRGSDPAWPASADLGGVTVAKIIARARAGEAHALATLRETGHFLGRGFATIVKAIEPRRIYVSGEISEAWDLVLPSVRQAMRDQALIPEAGDTEMVVVPLGEHPRLRGAAALVNSPAFAAPVVA
jgi:predicted NBD/HSP70 family sugar kinase